MQIVGLLIGRAGSIQVQWNHESYHYSHFIYQSCKAVTLLCPREEKNCTILISMCVLNCLNRPGGGTTILYILSLLLSRTGSIRVQWNHESHHYSHIIYQSCKTVTLLCPPERKNCSILNSMCFLHCLNRREGGNTILYILSLLLSRTGSIRVQWNPECHHYSHFIDIKHAKLMVCCAHKKVLEEIQLG